MPRTRAKRALEETDPNAAATAPPAKRTSTGKAKATAKSKTQATSEPQDGRDASSNTASHKSSAKTFRIPTGPNGETFLPRMLPEESLDIGGSMVPMGWTMFDGTPDREMTLRDGGWWAEHHKWLKKNAKHLGLSQTQWDMEARTVREAKPSELPQEDHAWIWIHPLTQHESDTDSEDSEGSEEGDSCAHCQKTCVAGEAIEKHPGHAWTMTVLGQERRRWWRQEAMKRDQDAFDLYVNNDFTWYGAIETVENAINVFDKEFSTKDQDKTPLSVWTEIEGLAFALKDGSLSFGMCDDGPRCHALIELVGNAVVATADYLIEKGQFKPDSIIRNLGLILALYLSWSFEQPGDFECGDGPGWQCALQQRITKHGIELVGPDTSAVFENISQPQSAKESKAVLKPRGWKVERQKYVREYSVRPFSIGGTNFDITTMPKSKLREYSLGQDLF